MSHFFNNLIGLAAARGLSIRAVSDGAGLPPSTLSRYVRRGPSANIRTSTVLAVAEFFGVSPEDMAEKELVAPVDAVTLAKVAPSADIDANDATPAQRPHAVPLVSQSVASDLVDKEDIPLADKLSPKTYERVPPPAFPQYQGDDRLLAFEVEGNALSPIIPDGSIVYFIKPEKDQVIPSGTIVLATTVTVGTEICEYYDDAPFITVRKYSTDEFGRIWLTSTNPDLPESVRVIQGGSVIGIVVSWCAKIR